MPNQGSSQTIESIALLPHYLNVWHTVINGAEINGLLLKVDVLKNCIFGDINFCNSTKNIFQLTLVIVIWLIFCYSMSFFHHHFGQKKYSRYYFAFHGTYDMGQFIEKSEFMMIDRRI